MGGPRTKCTMAHSIWRAMKRCPPHSVEALAHMQKGLLDWTTVDRLEDGGKQDHPFRERQRSVLFKLGQIWHGSFFSGRSKKEGCPSPHRRHPCLLGIARLDHDLFPQGDEVRKAPIHTIKNLPGHIVAHSTCGWMMRSPRSNGPSFDNYIGLLD